MSAAAWICLALPLLAAVVLTIGAVGAAAALLVEVIVAIGLKAGGRLSDEADVRRSFGGPAQIGRLFLTDHLLAFEITSVVLLAAAVGGVVLGAHARRGEWGSAAPERRRTT